MDGFSILDKRAWQSGPLTEQPEYHIGNALGWLYRGDKQASTQHALAGRLYVAKSGWLLLSVPNALVRGVYDAMTAPGAELPLAGTMNVPNVASDVLNAHVSVMTADEVASIGADKINERGHMIGYSLGQLKEITPRNVAGVSKVWALQVSAPMLSAIRKSYGLPPLINGHPFHITVAVRRKKVLQENNVSKAASDLTQLAPKWGDRDHLLAALPKHLTDTQTAITSNGNVDKEMTDLALIAKAWLKSQKQKQLLSERLKKFQETAAHPSLAAPKVAAELPWRERVEVLTRHPKTGKIYGGVWKEDKSFAAPGGGLDPGETPEQAAVRELLEETGIQAINPVRLPIGPVDNAWSDEYRQRTGRNFAGSRTHFVTADFVKRLHNKNLDAWSATQRKFYTPEQALETMKDKNYMAVAVAEGRRAALQHIIAQAVKKQAAADALPGGGADNMPDSKFPKKELEEGAEHEHEHTNDDQIAKEIAKDHLQEDPSYYEKVRKIEKDAASGVLEELRAAKEHSDNKRYAHKHEIIRRLMAKAPQDWVIDDNKPKFKGVTHKPTKFKFHTDPTTIPESVKAAARYRPSVYQQQLYNMYNLQRPIRYDFNKSLFDNVADQARDVKSRGDFMLKAQRNYQSYKADTDAKYRHELAMKAINNELEEPALVDQVISRYGDSFLNTALGAPK